MGLPSRLIGETCNGYTKLLSWLSHSLRTKAVEHFLARQVSAESMHLVAVVVCSNCEVSEITDHVTVKGDIQATVPRTLTGILFRWPYALCGIGIRCSRHHDLVAQLEQLYGWLLQCGSSSERTMRLIRASINPRKRWRGPVLSQSQHAYNESASSTSGGAEHSISNHPASVRLSAQRRFFQGF